MLWERLPHVSDQISQVEDFDFAVFFFVFSLLNRAKLLPVEPGGVSAPWWTTSGTTTSSFIHINQPVL